MRMNKNIVISAVLMLFCIKGAAQSMASASSGGIGVFYTLEPQRKFRNAAGGYKYYTTGFNAKIPLFGSRPDNPQHFFETSLQADLQTTSATFGFISNKRNFVNGSLGMGAIIDNGGKNTYLLGASLGISADEDVINKSNTRYRFAGSFIVNHKHSSKTLYQYGAMLTYSYGKPLPLPVAGIRTKISADWTFSAILPVEVSFMNKFSEKAGIHFTIRPAGNRFQFDNQGNFATASPTVFLQLREFQVGTSLYYKLCKRFTVTGETGLLLGGKLNFTEQDDSKTSVFETGVKPGPMFRLSLHYRFQRNSRVGFLGWED